MQHRHWWDMRVSDALKRRRNLSSHGVLIRKCLTQLPSAFVWVTLTRTPRAMATDPRPMRDSPAVVDTAGLTQSELLSLSRSTRSSSEQRDVLIPEIDPSVFNESDATRRQTYSEFRPWKRRKRRQVASPVGEVGLESGGRELDDNHLIVRMLKNLIRSSPLHDPAEEERVRWDGDGMVERRVADFGGGGDGDGKRKRVRRDEVKVVDDEIVNRNGVVVDLVVLENAVDPYGEELRRRTAVLESEEECLGFLRGLDGKWASKRRKRRIVDACVFGDHLPVTWKLLLALRRKEGRIWVYCRSYISPNGQEFVSCKDVALYLQSVFGVMNDDQLVHFNMENTQNHAGALFKDDSLGNSIVPVVDSLTSSLHDEQRSEGAPHGTENLVEVQVSSLFKCLLCKFVFHEKKLYLKHVLSSHEKTTRRYRIGSRVRGGVILNERQYECQFCYRIFQEKDSYISHVGSHIIGNSNERLDRQCADTNAELSTLFNDGLQKTLSELGGASNKNLPNTVDTYTVQYVESGGSLTNTEPNVVASKDDSCYELVSAVPAAPEIMNSQSINEIRKQALENQDTKKDLGNQLTLEGNNVLVREIFSDTSRIANPLDNMVSHAGDFKQLAAQHSKVPESKTQDLSGNDEMCSQEYISSTQVANSEHPTIDKKEIEKKGSNLHIHNSVETETNTDIEMKQNLERNVMTSGEIGSFGDFFKSEHVSEGENPSSLRHLESITEIEELKLDDIEPLKFSFPICDESSLMPVATMDVQNDADVYDFDSTRVDVGDIMCSMERRHQVTSVCVWCRSEFIHETLNSELQGDSVGYICTTCKAKISGQLNVSTMVYP